MLDRLTSDIVLALRSIRAAPALPFAAVLTTSLAVAINLAMLIVIMGTYSAAGLVTKATLPLFAIVAPAMLIPTFLGTRMYK